MLTFRFGLETDARFPTIYVYDYHENFISGIMMTTVDFDAYDVVDVFELSRDTDYTPAIEIPITEVEVEGYLNAIVANKPSLTNNLTGQYLKKMYDLISYGEEALL
jgi:hypothetical protein